MSHLECRLNRRSKKIVQDVQIWRWGEVIWTKSKRTTTFYRETFPKGYPVHHPSPHYLGFFLLNENFFRGPSHPHFETYKL